MLREFFVDDKGLASMTRLLMFMSFWPASWIVLEDQSIDKFSYYLGAFCGVYAWGKGTDAIKNRNVDSGEAETDDVGGDSINVSGRVSVDSPSGRAGVSTQRTDKKPARNNRCRKT